MNALGSAAVVAALLVAIYAVVAALIGTRGDRRWVISSRRAVYSMFGLLLLAVVILEAAFLRSDLSFQRVADYSSTTTPTLYKATALWGSQSGSLMLWAFVLSIAASIVLHITRNRHREVVPWATAVMAGVAVFFIGLMVAGIFIPSAESWPFAVASPAPVEGVGLTPLLRNPAMAIHPPMLYSGYVFFTVPFAFAVGALITRRLDASWIRSTRRFALIAWLFLTLGIVLGSRWSYNELGWGGYWGWDPVENAALIPWLTGTAFLHSIMVQERRGMLRAWNVSLICATFVLSLLGTFLVRSGVLQSIHAFGASKVGVPLLVLIGVVTIGTTVLIVRRLDSLRSERRLDSLLSRESIFLVNNLLIVTLAAVILWGTFFPLISEALTGEPSSLAAPWFNRYATPLAIGLALFTGIGPLIAWRRMSLVALRRAVRVPALVAAAVALALAFTIGISASPTAFVMFVLVAFTITAILSEVWQGIGARRSLAGGSRLGALGSLFARNRRRYGGYTVHLGLVLVFFAVAASSSFQTSRDLRLLPGQQAQVGDYTVTYERPTSEIDGYEQKLSFGALLTVTKGGEQVGELTPSREYYSGAAPDAEEPLRSFFEGGLPTSEVGRDEGMVRDLWSSMQPDLASFDGIIDRGDEVLSEFAANLPPGDPQSSAAFAEAQGLAVQRLQQEYMQNTPAAEIRFNVNPFVAWFWIGALIGVAGALFGLWPTAEGRRRRVSDVYGARLARELSSA